MFNALFFRRSPWADRLSHIAQTAGDLLHHHGIYCLVGAFRVDDGRTSRLLIELRGDLGEIDPAYLTSIKALLVHGLNKDLKLGLTGANIVLAISGEDVSHLPTLKAASLNVLQRRQAASAAVAPPAEQAIVTKSKPPVESTEFGESGWTLFAATVAVKPASSRFGEL
jgi:hypothetical protein